MIVQNGLVLLPGQEQLEKVDLCIENGVIAAVGRDLAHSGEVLDAGGLWVFPGGIDPHVHFDDPGYTDREDFTEGSSAAASGGITTVIDMPCTSVPPVTSLDNMREKLAVIEKKSVVDFGLYGGVCAQSFAGNDFQRHMEELAQYVLGFKTYFISGMETYGRLNHYQFGRVLEVAWRVGLPVLLHAEDYDYVTAATEVAQRSGHSPRQYYESRPEVAETLAVLAALELAERVGADLHIVHLGTARAAELLRGRAATGETTPQHLEFDELDFERIGGPLKVTPPVKGPENKAALWQLLRDGVIDFVASDHAPCQEKDKMTGSVWTDYAGIPGVGTLFPYMLSEGYFAGRLSLRQLARVTSGAAAQRYGLSARKGSIGVGKDADLVLIDPEAEWVVEGQKFLSKGKVTPFEGMRCKGRIVKTLLRGQVIYDSETGVQVRPGYGQWIRRPL